MQVEVTTHYYDSGRDLSKDVSVSVREEDMLAVFDMSVGEWDSKYSFDEKAKKMFAIADITGAKYAALRGLRDKEVVEGEIKDIVKNELADK